eukprot:scaffold64469_cov16-Prasinocladus_malaysianus.AAC.1
MTAKFDRARTHQYSTQQFAALQLRLYHLKQTTFGKGKAKSVLTRVVLPPRLTGKKMSCSPAG